MIFKSSTNDVIQLTQLLMGNHLDKVFLFFFISVLFARVPRSIIRITVALKYCHKITKGSKELHISIITAHEAKKTRLNHKRLVLKKFLKEEKAEALEEIAAQNFSG